MAVDKKISQLTSLAQVDVVTTTDVLPIVDTSVTETKKITVGALVGAGAAAGLTGVDINSGSIDGTTIGASSASTGAFTTLSASGAVTLNPANAAVSLAPTGTGTVTINPATAGTLNNVAIGGSSAAAGTFTSATVSTGNLTFSSTGQRITGDMSNATIASRLAFQTSTTNGATDAAFVPNGTGSISRAFFYNQSDLSSGNLSANWIGSTSTEFSLRAAIHGTGTYLPMTFYTSGSERMRLDTSGNLGIGKTATSGVILDANGVSRSTQIQMPNSAGTYTANVAGFHLFGFSDNNLYFNWFDAGAIVFRNNGANERMRIDSSGNVGIGNTAANVNDQVGSVRPLLVSTSDSVTTIAGSKANIVIGNADTTTNNTSQLSFAALTGASTTYFAAAAINCVFGARTNAQYPTGQLVFSTSTSLNSAPTEKMRIDSSGNVGIGTASPVAKTQIAVAAQTTVGNSVGMWIGDSTGGAGNVHQIGFGYTGGSVTKPAAIIGGINENNGGNTTEGIFFATRTAITDTAPTERMRIDSSGNVGIGGTAGANEKLRVGGTLPTSSNFSFGVISNGTVPSGTTTLAANFYSAGTTQATSFTLTDYQHFRVWQNGFGAGSTVTNQFGYYVDSNLTGATNNYGFYSNIASASNRWNFYAAGTANNYFAGLTTIGTTNGDPVGNNVAGGALFADGRIQASVSSGASVFVNRKTDDGTLVAFYQDGTQEGTISVSGNTVSYNAFAGSHWSQLQDNSKPDILRGTVMESINELCVWPDENNERLPKSKISDTAGSKKVYGVFMAWDNDWTATNDMLITSVGAFICRVNSSVTVQEGDLLESNGDGTARVQADDIIRSSTIGKVTSTVKTHQYADGSYCVPTVLYCG